MMEVEMYIWHTNRESLLKQLNNNQDQILMASKNEICVDLK